MIVIKLWFCIFQIKICMFVFVCINVCVCVCKNPEFRTELSTNRVIFFTVRISNLDMMVVFGCLICSPTCPFRFYCR